MVTRNGPWPVGTPCWVSLDTDVARASAFYTAVLGWRVEVAGPESGGYATAYVGQRRVAGLWPKQDPESAGGWFTYLSTADARLDAARITDAGGDLLIPATTVLDLGVMVLAVDPVGAVFGLWQSAAHTGVELAGEPGSLAWSEQLSREPARAKEFYTAAFGFAYREGDPGHALISLDVGEPPVAGIGTGEPGWVSTFRVADTDATAELLVEHGGAVVEPPRDTGSDRLATVTDDQGALFRLSSAR